MAALERIYLGYRESPAFEPDVIFAMRQLDSELAWRAVWLLRRRARDQGLEEHTLLRMVAIADEMTHWIARLILCQILMIAGCPGSVRDPAYQYLVECFRDRRAIVRAWAISALAAFRDEPRYRRQVLSMMKEARRDGAKSMRARLRHLATRGQSSDSTIAPARSRARHESRHR